MVPEDVPDGTEFEDHFWVEIEDGEITALQFDPELTEQKREKYQAAEEIHRKMQELSRQASNDNNRE